MTVWNQFWADESGAILTAEAVMVGSIAVLGGMVGLSAAANAVNDEMTEVASALRSLDQSYVIAGHSGCRSWKAGSYYIQPRVEESLRELCGEGEVDVVGLRDEIDQQRDLIYPSLQSDEPPPNDLPPKKSSKRKPELKKPAPQKVEKSKPAKD